MKKLFITTIFVLGIITNISAQKWLYYGYAPYAKTPFTGEFSLKRTAENVDTIDYVGVVGGRAYFAIDRDEQYDIYNIENYYYVKRTYDENNNLKTVESLNTNTNKWDTVMSYTYDSKNRIVKSKEEWQDSICYRGCYSGYFYAIYHNMQKDNDTSGKCITEYDYDKNTINRTFTYYRSLDGVIDTITDFFPSTVTYICDDCIGKGYKVVTGYGDISNVIDETDFSFDSRNRLIKAGDVEYSYSDNFTPDDIIKEKKGDTEYTYTFNDDGYPTKVTSTKFDWMGFRYTTSPLSNEVINKDTKTHVSYSENTLIVTFDEEAPFDIAVYNMKGALVVNRQQNQGKATISLSSLTQGVYIVRISSGSYNYTQKIII